jgi:hypothetical protein
VFREGVRLSICHVTFATEHLEIEVENFVEFAVPIVDKAGRHNHERSCQLSPTSQLAQDQRSLNCFAKPYLVSNQEAARGRSRNAMGQRNLMR